jgi:hypothetical protein
VLRNIWQILNSPCPSLFFAPVAYSSYFVAFVSPSSPSPLPALPPHHQSSALTIDKARDLHASVAPHVVDAGMQPYAVSAGMSVSALLGATGTSGSGSGDGAKSLIKKLISLQKDVAATTTAAAAAAATK